MKCKGFTLIELSIVLIIIGLIVGGVLVGKDLIRAAELNSIETFRVQVASAVYTFKNKYNCIPGDCANATQFFGPDTSCPNTASNTVPKSETCNGNGDGKVGDMEPNGTSTDANLQYEWYRFWQQLGSAGLIEGTYTGVRGPLGSYDAVLGVNVPRSKISGVGFNMIWYGYIDNTSTDHFPHGNSQWFGAGGDTSTGSGPLSIPFLTPLELYNMDIKYDDGFPAYGKIMGTKKNSSTLPNCTTTDVASTAAYDISNNNKACLYRSILYR